MNAAAAWPRITVVMPSFDQGDLIEASIRSVVDQRYPDLEFIVVDGGSRDGTLDVIRKYGRSIAHWVSEPDRGQAHALNKGFARASGAVRAYLNSDDLLTPGTLEMAATALRERLAEPAIVSFAGVEFGTDRADLRRDPPRAPRLDEWLSSPVSLFQPSTFWTSTLHAALGGFREDLHYCFDKEFFLRAIFGGGEYVARPDWVASRFRIHGRSKSSTIGDLMEAENRAIAKYHGRGGKPGPSFDDVLAAELRALHARRRSQGDVDAALRSARPLEMVRLLLSAARAEPERVLSRPYLGAWKQVLRKSLGSR